MKLPEKKQRWVYHAEALPQAAGEGVTRRVLAYTDGLMCVENTFEKGAVGALHHHPHTQITYVVSGAFEFTVDGVTHTVRAGDTILKEDGVEHGCVCTEAGILLDIFTLCGKTSCKIKWAAAHPARGKAAAHFCAKNQAAVEEATSEEAASEDAASLAASEEALFSSATAEEAEVSD